MLILIKYQNSTHTVHRKPHPLEEEGEGEGVEEEGEEEDRDDHEAETSYPIKNSRY